LSLNRTLDFHKSIGEIFIEIEGVFKYFLNSQSICRVFSNLFNDHLTIIPVGEMNLTYYDESLIRNGEYDSQKVNELKYTVIIKEIYTDSINVDMYLEVNLSNPEK